MTEKKKESNEPKEPEKTCPLFAMIAGREESIHYSCILGECAWWIKEEITMNYRGRTITQVKFEGCAITVIAERIRRS